MSDTTSQFAGKGKKNVWKTRQVLPDTTETFCVQCCMCRKRLSSPRCRSELIDSAWVVIVPGQKCIKKNIHKVVIG